MKSKPLSILLSILVLAVIGFSIMSVPVAASGVGSWMLFYPTNISYQSCVVSGGYVYCVGGFTGISPYYTSAVYYAKLTSTGVGAWTMATNSYPITIEEQSCVLSGTYIYCVGGYNGIGVVTTSAVYFANLTSTGVSTWTSTTGYPTTIQDQSCGVNGGYIYCVAGYTGSAYTNAVYFAKLSSSGVGTWTSTTGYLKTVKEHSCVVNGGYIYCVAGQYTTASPYYTSAVYFAKLSATGVGTWTSTTAYPTPLESERCVVNGGYAYCVGGDLSTTTAAYTNAVYFAKLSSSGVGTWTSTTNNYPTNIYAQSCVVSGGYVYCVGGNTSHTSTTAAVYFAKL